MKKIYSQPIWKVMVFKAEDVITASGDGKHEFEDGQGIMSGNADNWEW